MRLSPEQRKLLARDLPSFQGASLSDRMLYVWNIRVDVGGPPS
jgi:hypothetical protein